MSTSLGVDRLRSVAAGHAQRPTPGLPNQAVLASDIKQLLFFLAAYLRTTTLVVLKYLPNRQIWAEMRAKVTPIDTLKFIQTRAC